MIVDLMIFGSGRHAILELYEHILEGALLGISIVAGEKPTQSPLGEILYFLPIRKVLQLLLNILFKSQEVHDLRNTSTRNAMCRCELRHGHAMIML